MWGQYIGQTIIQPSHLSFLLASQLLFCDFPLIVCRKSIQFCLSEISVLAPSSSIWSCWAVLFSIEAFRNFQELFRRFVFLNVIDSQRPSTNFSPIEIVHCQNCRSLVLISQEGKAFRLTSNFVSGQTQIDYFSKL